MPPTPNPSRADARAKKALVILRPDAINYWAVGRLLRCRLTNGTTLHRRLKKTICAPVFTFGDGFCFAFLFSSPFSSSFRVGFRRFGVVCWGQVNLFDPGEGRPFFASPLTVVAFEDFSHDYVVVFVLFIDSIWRINFISCMLCL